MVYIDRATWPAADLVALSDDGYHYDLVNGRLIRMAPAGADHGSIASRLDRALGSYADAYGGETFAAGTGFNLTYPDEALETILAPDAAYIRETPGPRDRHGFLGRPPDIAVEVASDSQFRPEMEEKARLWLDRGCGEVWLVWPRYKTIEIWRREDTAPRRVLRPGDVLQHDDLLPGFRYVIPQFGLAS